MRAPEPLLQKRPNSGARGSTAVLLRKNLLLKRRQYANTCRCCCGIPLPLALLMEFVMPICVIGFVSWLKTLTDFDVIVDGWGGDTPSNSRSTACVAGVHYFWSPAITSAFSGASPSNRISDCTPFNELVTVPRPFFHLLAQLHWYEDAKLGMAADRAEDVPKLEKMRAWISENWYPRRRMRNIPMCRDNSLTHYPFRASGFDRKYNKKSCYPRVHYTHDGRRRSTMMGTISNFLDVTHVHGAGTTSEMDDYIRSPDYGVAGPKFAFAIVFHQIPGDGRPGSIGDWDYSIRMNYTFGSIGSTNFMPVRPLARGISDWHQDLYSWEGFASLQLLVDRYILNKRAQIQAAPLLAWNPSMAHYAEQEDADNHEYLAEPLRYAPQLVQTVPLPMHGYILDTFYEIVKAVFALLFLLMYMHPTFSMIAAFIDEKETRTREGLRMMGVRNGALIASAYVLHACVFFVLNLLMTIASCGPSGAVFDKTSSSVVFVLLNLFSATAISFSYMIHNFYNKARTGAIAGALKFMCCYFIYASTFDFSEGNVKPGGSLSLCLFSPAAFSFGLSLLSQYEAAAIGAHWNNLDIDVGGGINLRTVMLMLVFDSIVYTVLGSYLEYVWPKEFGVQRPFWFPCVKSYWCPHHAQRDDVRAVNHLQHGAWSRARFRQLFTMPRQRQLSENEATAAITAGFDPTSGDGARDAASTSFVEEVTPSLKAQESTGNCLQIQGLRRTFSTPDGEKVAVAGLNLNIYEGQITALLGHNGAGKTTTIHMLTGLIEPTSGDALVYGKRLTTEMESIRQIIGVCPQHDVLFGLLTVLEHLQFYCRLKCPLMTAQELQDAVRDTVAGVGLTEKLHTRSNALSGGQKRKLSLGISLIGNPKVVFLDEPTSGMDPYSRRSTWNSLRAHREGRCMVLTSHFMDEADLLGDRIAILAEGQLRCCGTSLFLKNAFGAGYTLTICKSNTCNASALIGVVREHIPEATLVSNVGTECSFKLPVSASGDFSKCFRAFDAHKAALGIEQYGCSITSMEEVFITVAHHDPFEHDTAVIPDSMIVSEVTGQSSASTDFVDTRDDFGTVLDRDRCCCSFCRHFSALFCKRVRYGTRDKSAACCTSVFPVFMLLLGLLMLKYATGMLEQNSLTLSANMFEPYGASEQLKVPFNSSRPTVRLGPVSMPGDSTPVTTALPVNLKVAKTTTTVYGVQYTADGLPTHSWRPRADRLPDYDQRHIPANRLDGAVNNAASVLAMSQHVMSHNFGFADGVKSFGAVLASQIDEGTSICDPSSILNNGVIYGDAFPISRGSDGRYTKQACVKTIEAPLGRVVTIRFVSMPPRVATSHGVSDTVRIHHSSPEISIFDSTTHHGNTVLALRTGQRKVTFTQEPGAPTVLIGSLARWQWSAIITFEQSCQDQDSNCEAAMQVLGQFKLSCTTPLDSVDVDTIVIPPEMLAQAQNVGGAMLSEQQLRNAAKEQLRAQLGRFGGANTLAEVCPVSCQTCSTYLGPVAETPLQFQCTGAELSAMQGLCVSAAAAPLAFCSSACNTVRLSPWLKACSQHQAAAVAEMGLSGFLVGSALALAQQCDITVSPPAAPSAPEGCWQGQFSAERCCNIDPPNDPVEGNIACWERASRPQIEYGTPYTFSSCCVNATQQQNNAAYTILYNGTAKHAEAVYTNIITNSMNAGRGSITLHNHPFPPTASAQALVDSIASLQAVLFILIAFAFVPGGVVVFVVREKESQHNSKHQQMVSGVRIPAYWISNYAWDSALYMVPLGFSMLIIKLVDLHSFTEPSAYRACFVLLLGFGWSIAPFTYCISFLYSSHTRAQIFTVLFNIFLGMALMITHYVMSLIPDTQDLNTSLLPFYRLSPAFCLGHGLWQLSIQTLVHQYLGKGEVYSALSPQIAGDDAFRLFILGPSYLLLAIAIDYCKSYPVIAMQISRFTQASLRKVVDEDVEVDEDVLAEAERVERAMASDIVDLDAAADIVQVLRLRKVYPAGGAGWLKLLLLVAIGSASYLGVVVMLQQAVWVAVTITLAPIGIWGAVSKLRGQMSQRIHQQRPKVAVRGVSFGIRSGECFGYLGINGAGKTSTMKMLTGDTLPTSGEARLDGMNVLTSQQACRRLIGYCPQFDALLDKLTVQEHLRLFARVRGVFRKDLDRVVASVMRRMDLSTFANKLASTLSGGNKRKLSVGIALIGGPKVVLLDEPTTGVDPVARRFLWNVISSLAAQQSCAVILTTHVMEEVEALCTRVGIMVGGRLRCLGSVQRLKGRFGRGYELQMKVSRPTEAECAALARHHDDTGGVTAENLAETCARFGDEKMASVVTRSNEAGWVLWDALQRREAVPLSTFCAWWLTEERVAAVGAFVASSFAGARLIERQGTRVDFALGHAALHVAEIFERVEAAKQELCIVEYSVAQDSMENIFNSFAAQQEEECGTAQQQSVQAAAAAAAAAAATAATARSSTAAGMMETTVNPVP